MNAIDTAKRIFAAQDWDLATNISRYIDRGGIVVIRPDMFLLARAIRLEDPLRWIGPGEGDAWYVRFLISEGGLRTALREMPHTLPWCAYRRGLRFKHAPLRHVSTDRIIRNTRGT